MFILPCRHCSVIGGWSLQFLALYPPRAYSGWEWRSQRQKVKVWIPALPLTAAIFGRLLCFHTRVFSCGGQQRLLSWAEGWIKQVSIHPAPTTVSGAWESLLHLCITHFHWSGGSWGTRISMLLYLGVASTRHFPLMCNELAWLFLALTWGRKMSLFWPRIYCCSIPFSSQNSIYS